VKEEKTEEAVAEAKEEKAEEAAAEAKEEEPKEDDEKKDA